MPTPAVAHMPHPHPLLISVPVSRPTPYTLHPTPYTLHTPPPPPLQTIKEFPYLCRALRSRLLWVCCHHSELPGFYDEAWEALVAGLEDVLLKGPQLAPAVKLQEQLASATLGCLYRAGRAVRGGVEGLGLRAELCVHVWGGADGMASGVQRWRVWGLGHHRGLGVLGWRVWGLGHHRGFGVQGWTTGDDGMNQGSRGAPGLAA